MESYCLQGKHRVYIIAFISVVITSLLFTTNISSGRLVNKETLNTGITFNVFSGLYTFYILWLIFTGETWEKSFLSKSDYISYENIIGGNIYETSYEKLYSAAENIPCYMRKRNSCQLEPNVKSCSWDTFEQKCKAPFSGGYFVILLFIAISIYLIIIGSNLLKETDDETTEIEFETIDKLAIANIIIGSLVLLFSVVDLFIC